VAFRSLLNRLIGDLSRAIGAQGRDPQICQRRADRDLAAGRGRKPARCLLASTPSRGWRPSSVHEREFGQRVEVRAALHCGPVVVGEWARSRRRSP
jgi:hypothetical protein